MALKKCEECGNQVSTKAQTCPKCGAPVKKEQKKYGCGTTIIVVIIIFVVLSILNEDRPVNDPPPKQKKAVLAPASQKKSTIKKAIEKTPEKIRDIVTNSEWDGSVYQVEDYLKDNLKDPDSYDNIEWGPVQKTNNGFMVRCKYRAKNSFGGYDIAHQVFLLNQNGDVTTVTNLQ